MTPTPPADETAWNPDEIARLIRSRRTINDFESRRPPDEIVWQALDLATWAPNHKLTEPWRFHWLGEVSIARIVELNAQLVTSAKGPAAAAKKRERWSRIPGWLAVTCVISEDPLRDQENQAAVCCAVQNLLLALWSQRIGSKWSTGEVIRTAEFAHILGIDPGAERILGLIWYGYPETIPVSRRSPIGEFVRRHP